MPNGRTAHRLGRILKLVFVSLVYGVCLLLLLRMCSAKTPKELRGLDYNPTLATAYANAGDLTLCYQNGDSITRAEPSKGYFAIPEYYYIPEANQVQLIFRYNNSTLKHVSDDYKIDPALTREGDWFDLSLVLAKQDGTSVRIQPAKIEKSLSKRLYVFYRITFDGVVVDDTTTGLFADIYYKDDIDYEKSAYGTLCLYDPAEKWLTKKPTKSDVKSLTQ
ncbi:MAG: hypothetical protein IJR88_00285 [Clostridia bacterium]|nr:hypothetical protein [Clostridia bacterium]